MLEKTIKKNIRKKIDSWLYSIKDLEIKNLIKENIIVSGGCIISMMQNEDVNDYDCYLRTLNSVTKICKYYLPQFSKYNKACDGVKVDENGQVKIYIKSTGKLCDRLSDKDVEKKVMYKPLFASSNAITLSHDIQIISRFYGEPEQLHTNFDFIHTKSYYDYKEDKLVIPKSVYEAVMNKRLIFTNSKYPLCSLFRMKKFLNRGWNISAGEILKISYKIFQLELNNILVLQDQLIGVDSAYFASFIEKLEKCDNIDENTVSKLVAEVFSSIEE